MNDAVQYRLNSDMQKYIVAVQDYLKGKGSGEAILDLDDLLFDTKSPFLAYLKVLPAYEAFQTAINIYNPEEKAQFPLSGLMDDAEFRPLAVKMVAELLKMQNDSDFHQ